MVFEERFTLNGRDGEINHLNQTGISPDSEGGWRCVSSAEVRSRVWNAEETGGLLVPHHWGCAAPGCLWGYSSSTVLQMGVLQLAGGWEELKEKCVNITNAA